MMGGCGALGEVVNETEGSVGPVLSGVPGKAPEKRGTGMGERRLDLYNNNDRTYVGGRWASLEWCWLEGRVGLMTEWGSRAPVKGAGQENGCYPEHQKPSPAMTMGLSASTGSRHTPCRTGLRTICPWHKWDFQP